MIKPSVLPGRITITGGIINDDPSSEAFGQLDPRITVKAQGGVSHLGVAAKVVDNHKPLITPPGGSSVRRVSSDETIVNIGCPVELVLEYASSHNLKLADLPKGITEDVVLISAHTILLCGKIPEFKESYVTLDSHELVMMDAEIFSDQIMGSFRVDTLRLSLSGKNKIHTQGSSSSFTMSLTKPIDLKVLFAMDEQSTGTLEVISVGSSYKAVQ